MALSLAYGGAANGVRADGFSHEVTATVDLLAYGTGTIVRDSPVNPDNAVAHLPMLTLGGQGRPSVHASLFDRYLELVSRPVLWCDVADVVVDDRHDPRVRHGLLWNALYAQLSMTPDLTLAYGRLPFEWGPAQFINASNRLFHLNALRRNAVFVLPGRELLKLSYYYGTSFSLVAIAELRNNGQPVFGNEDFDKKGLLKLEYESETGRYLSGLVFGGGEVTRPWLGGYGSVEVLEGWLLYMDAAFTLGSSSLHPVLVEQDGNSMVRYRRTLAESKRLETLGVVGSKYTTKRGVQLGVEWIANTAGYDRREMRLAFRAVALPSDLPPDVLSSNRADRMSPGLELLARHSLYTSVLVPALSTRLEARISCGYLISATDGSGALLAYAEVALGPNAVAIANVSVSHGAVDSENATLSFGQGLVGTRVTF